MRPERVLAILVLLAAGAVVAAEPGDLHPPSEPFASGYLDVGGPHEIYYELCGNPDGRPVFVLHGGPGAGCYPRMRRYFDPEAWLVVLHDQRGAGRSRPLGELEGNTTWDLVADIERLREHVGVESFVLFGGSWGTTLGLAYAEAHPERVEAMILRGVFLGTEEEIGLHYEGNRHFFPAEYDRLLATLPDPGRGADPDYLHGLIVGEDRDLALRVMDALGAYEIKFMKLHIPDEAVRGFLQGMPVDERFLFTGLDLHYVTHRYFLEPGQLLRDVDRIARIPTVIINGRYDMACPVGTAYALHQALPESRLVIVEEAGHSETEPGITRALVEAATSLEGPAQR